MKKQAIVIGSGISGLSVSRMISPAYEVTILEKATRPGGLIKCVRIDGNLFHLVGGHVFNSKVPAVLEWFWQHFDRETEFLSAKRKAAILLNDELIGYPIESFIYQLPSEWQVKIINDLLETAAGKSDPSLAAHFEEFLRMSFGKTLYEIYFGPYNFKIWNTDLSKVPLEWLDGKLPMPRIPEILLSNINRNREEEMVHSTFYYPVKDGSQFIVDRLANGLTIKTDTEVVSIDYRDGMLFVNDAYAVNILIYSGDIRKLGEMIRIKDELLAGALADVKTLFSNGTSNVLCETDPLDVSWLYLPESRFKAHRIIYTGNFSSTNNAGSNRRTCVVEFSGYHSEEDIVNELELLPGNLKPLAFNYEPNSYVIQNTDTRAKIGHLKKLLEKYSIYILGRFSEWEYYNMDKCIEKAMELSKTLCPLT